jgi:hypothetical protein
MIKMREASNSDAQKFDGLHHQLVDAQTRFKPMRSSKRAFPLSFGPWTSLLPDTSLPVRRLFAKVAGAAQYPKSSP